MKKTNTIINIAMVVLFAAMLIYLGVYIFHSTQQGYVTAPAVVVTVNESGQASGCVVREEQLLTSDKAYVSVSVDDGSEVARGLNAQHRVGQTVEQRAVEGDAVGVKERGELRDGALVRGVFLRAA